ncbi:MAG TPA: hypothetical protein VFU88_18315 [Ktedonobacterales bacterium]|nr:hypothetical protein [Ktedonobacterales bacterium]
MSDGQAQRTISQRAARGRKTRLAAARCGLDDITGIARLGALADMISRAHEPRADVTAGRETLTRARRVGLLAGTFNPLTVAHTALAESACTSGQVEAIVWTLAVVSVDKERLARASLADRLVQLDVYARAAATDNAVVLVNRGLYVDQARALRGVLPPDVALAIVVGFDKLVQIFDPRYYEDRDAALDALFAEAELLVAPREGFGAEDIQALLAQPENRRYAARVRRLALAAAHLDDSSSRVRALAAAGASRQRIARLTAPEGFALVDTGAYVAGQKVGGRDHYGWRVAWEQALAEQPDLADGLAGLSTLVERTMRADAPGADLRAWLAAPRGTTPPPGANARE